MTLDLKNILLLIEKLAIPIQNLPPIVHVAGTNGKGSTIKCMEKMLQAGGYKVHKYSSPHLISPCERIVLGSTKVEAGMLRSTFRHVEKKHPTASYFEKLTATAFLLFSSFPADLILLEVGLGGRMDATNVVNSILSVITSISKDHTEILGHNLRSIAMEKAGIIKRNSICVSTHQEAEVLDVLRNKCKEVNTQLHLDQESDGGNYKDKNASLARLAVNILSKMGFENAKPEMEGFPDARLQKISVPMNASPQLKEIILDGAHNTGGGLALKESVQGDNLQNYALVCMHERKEINEFIKTLKTFCEDVNFMKMESERPWIQSLRGLMQMDTKKPYRLILTGSLYFSGEVLRTYIQKPQLN